jgi:hypothetical protein
MNGSGSSATSFNSDSPRASSRPDEYLAEAMRYIAFNPVRAGLCGHPSEWPWSNFFNVQDFAFDR